MARSAEGFWLVAFGMFVVFMASSVPTPLYPIYEERFGFSTAMLTVVFAVYVVGVLGTLLLFGNLSDKIGRRPVLLLGLGSALAGSAAFIAAGGVTALVIGRLFSGAAIGIFSAAGTAALLDLEPEGNRGRATLVATATTTAGQAIGLLLSGELAQHAPSPLRLVWLAHLVLLALATLLIWRLPDDWRPLPPGGLRPQPLRVPSAMRRLFVASAAAVFSFAAILGLFLALAPALLREMLHLDGAALSGEVVALLFAASTIAQLTLRWLPCRVAASLGLGIMVFGLAALVAAEIAASFALFIVAVLLDGIGQGMTFMGAVGEVNHAAPPDRRGQVVSSLYVFSFLGFALPVLGVGLAAGPLGLRTATAGFAAVIGAIAIVAMIGIRRADADHHAEARCHEALAGAP